MIAVGQAVPDGRWRLIVHVRHSLTYGKRWRLIVHVRHSLTYGKVASNVAFRQSLEKSSHLAQSGILPEVLRYAITSSANASADFWPASSTNSGFWGAS